MKRRVLTLEAIAEHPLITYAERSNGKRRLMRAFGAWGYTPKIIFSAGDEDVVKACVEEEGLGITILVSIVYDPKRDTGLGARDVSSLLEPSVTGSSFAEAWLGMSTSQRLLSHSHRCGPRSALQNS